MEDRAKLAYFLNAFKEELGFENPGDFKNKIENDFYFRFKVQKFVFLAKFFEWDNNYRFSLYPRGPYSGALAEDYYSNVFDDVGVDDNYFMKDSFKHFVEDKSEYDLEATSTILFFKSFNQDFSLEAALNTLNEIKPHINNSIVEKAYFEVDNLKVVSDLISPSVSSDYLENLKSNLLNKIVRFISGFEKFELSDNSKFIILSLNYLKSILLKEKLDNPLKNDLLNFIYQYISKIDEIYAVSNGRGNIFKEMNISSIKESFNILENYICCELDISPRFFESDDLDIQRIYEEYYLIRDFILTGIVPKYDELSDCELCFEDETGNPSFEYFIKSKMELPYSKWDELTCEIISMIYEFCIHSNFEEIFKTISIFLVRE